MMPKRKGAKSTGNDSPTKTPKTKKTKKTDEEVDECIDVKNSVIETDTKTDVITYDSTPKTKTADGRDVNVRIISWNVAGIRAWIKKDGLKSLLTNDPDIVCLQETKITEKDTVPEVKQLEVGGLKPSGIKYHMYWSYAEKKGYSGTALWSKVKPLSIKKGLGKPEHDNEGRIITAEFEDYYVVTSYVPNAGRGLVRLDYRQTWDKDLQDMLNSLKEKKPVIYCGDLNVAHTEIDLANPKANKKNAGFTEEERQGMTNLLDSGFIDTFRHLYPQRRDAYTFWTYMGNARQKNVGWRLDYFIVSKDAISNVCDNFIQSSILGSDHCPVLLNYAH